MTVDANPIDGGGGAPFLVLLGGSELGGFFGEHELHQRDAAAHLDQALGAGPTSLTRDLEVTDVLRREHRNMVQTNVRRVKVFELLIRSFIELIYARRAGATLHASTLPASRTHPLPSPSTRRTPPPGVPRAAHRPPTPPR